MTKKCPKCQQDMIKISLDQALDEKWICVNASCGYSESQHLLDIEQFKKEIGQP